MADLVSKSPALGLLPVEAGNTRLDECRYDAITWVAPYDGQEEAVGRSLGFAFPGPNETTGQDGARAIWVGPSQALVLGGAVSPEGAAVADQSSGWAVLELSGADARDVLARLTPVDLRDGAFPAGATARTVIGHMTGSITRTGADTYEIMVFRSMAKTAVHELERAMKGVAARTLVRA